MSEEKECAKAKVNPKCPYLLQINQHAQDLQTIKKALLGEDGTGMNSGIVFEIGCLKSNNKIHSSWINTFRPLIVSVVTAIVTAAITFIVTH